MQFSSFAPFGTFAFSSETPPAEKIFDATVEALGPAFQGPNDLAETYADSMCFGVAQAQIDAAGEQDNAETCSYLLPDLEKDWKVYPRAGASDAERRVALGVAMAAHQGASQDAVIAGLRLAIGDRLIHARTMSNDDRLGEVENSPTTPMPRFPASEPIRRVTFPEQIFPGTWPYIAYSLDFGANPLKAGDVVLVDPGNFQRAEQVTIAAAYPSSVPGTSGIIGATFTQTHDEDTPGLTGPYSWWMSNRRHWMVIVAPGYQLDSETRTLINEFMRKTLPAVSTWDIYEESDPVAHEISTLVVGDGVGCAPLGIPTGPSDPLITDPTGTYL